MKNKEKKAWTRSYIQKSLVKRILLVTFLVFVTSVFSLYGTLVYAMRDSLAFNDIPSVESPYPFLDLDEDLAHLIVEGNPDEDGILGAEERQARYHAILGYIHSVVFWPNRCPDDENNTVDDIACMYLGSLGDAAFLTGLYLFGQALRWAVYDQENNPDGVRAAEYQIKRTLEGLYILTHVAGTSGELVRYALPLDINYSVEISEDRHTYFGKITPAHECYNKEYPNNKHYYPAQDWTNWMYKDDTSRDQNIGVMMGLAGVIAFCKNQTLVNLAGEIACEIVDFLINSHWLVNTNNWENSERFTNGADFETGLFQSGWSKLAFLQVARQINPKYDAVYKQYFTTHNQFLKLDTEKTLHYVLDSYFPLNLLWCICWMFSYFIDKNDPFYDRIISTVEQTAYYPVRNHRNAWFQSLYLSLLTREKMQGMTQVITEIRDAIQRMCLMRKEHFVGLWHDPYEEIGFDPNNETQMNIFWDTSAEKWNHRLGFILEPLKNEANIKLFTNHTRYPIPINYRRQYDFPWQFSPFLSWQLSTERTNRIEYFHTELTIIYWFARYLGIIDRPKTPFSPKIFNNSDVMKYWPELSFPPAYGNTTSILEAYNFTSIDE
ncbi:MAG: hypothetical protein ACTSXP_13390 [Promethearchaeota archaeon]